jgi:hypothetical protein
MKIANPPQDARQEFVVGCIVHDVYKYHKAPLQGMIPLLRKYVVDPKTGTLWFYSTRRGYSTMNMVSLNQDHDETA